MQRGREWTTSARRVLRKVASGKTDGQIATELDVSVSDVSADRVRILDKMGMSTTVELTRYALRNHLVEGR